MKLNPEIELLQAALQTLQERNTTLPAFSAEFDSDAARDVLLETARRMQDNYPFHHPQYAGQMLKPPHPVARIAYALSLWVNPNNHALDGGRASSAMEKECVQELAAMYGWTQPLGHLTGGGTMANLEALWVSHKLSPGKRVIASQQAHYTHERISDVLGIPFTPIACDRYGRMRVDAVETELAKGDVGTVVATMGTTGAGAVDPLTEILDLRQSYDFRLHADAAYGGYFVLSSTLDSRSATQFEALAAADSIVIDPHKHGLQPYGCGCVLFKDPDVGRFYKHGSPYTYFSSAELHLGEISLECSRPGAAAVALWATQKMFPLRKAGQFAQGLDQGLNAARRFSARLHDNEHYRMLMPPELDIVIYLPKAKDTASVNKKSRQIFEAAAARELHLALIDLPAELATPWLGDIECNTDSVCCLRSVLMKPDHSDWVDPIIDILEDVSNLLHGPHEH